MNLRGLALPLTGFMLTMLAFVAGADGKPPPGLPVGSSLGEPAPARVPVVRIPDLAIGADPALGAAEAQVTIVEFLDYQCPYCQGFAKDTFPLLKSNYVDTGKVRYVSRDFPLAKHGRARPAAIAAACAREQGRYWEMREALLADAGHLDDADILRHAGRLGLDRNRFDACRLEARHQARLDADVAAARALGVSGTPSFLVGASQGELAQGRLLQGDESYADFEKVLAGYLSPRP
jgi:protein-disulfide isomerase